MKISIVVPAYNEAKLISGTLRNLKEAAQGLRARNFEVELIVCDNNSSDRTAQLAAAEGATVVFEPVNQIARARNRGAQAATGDWLLFIDADSYPSRELLADLAEKIRTGKYLGGGANVIQEGRDRLADFLTWLWNALSRWKRWAPGSFVYCQRHAFEELGGFSHELFITEEIEFSERLKRYARKQGKELVILSRYPMITSTRKLGLYSKWEHLKFGLRFLRSPRATLRNRDECHVWYDGRR